MRYLWTLFALAAAQTGGGYAAAQAVPDAALKVVVANQQSASATIIGVGTPVHVDVGTGPHEAAISPDGRVAVVTIYGTQQPGNRLAVIDLHTDAVTRTIDLGAYTRPHGVVFPGNRSDIVVVTSESTNNIVIVDLASGAVEAVPTHARGSHMVAIDAAGTRAWTANISDNSVSEIDLVSRQFVRSVLVPPQPEGIAVTPDGSEVWVGSNTTGAVSVVETATGSIVHTVPGMVFPYRLAAAPNGERVLIVDAKGDAVVVVDTRTREVAGSVFLAAPRGVAVSPDSRTAYVTQAAGEVAVVDLATMSVSRFIAVGVSPDGVAAGVVGTQDGGSR